MKTPFYCTYDAFVEIVTSPGKHPLLHELITRHAKLILDIPQTEITKKIINNDILLKTFQKQQGILLGNPQFFETLLSGNKVPQEATGAITILNCDEEKIAQIRRTYGILAIGATHLNITGTTPEPVYNWSWDKNESRNHTCGDNKSYQGWAAILKPITEVSSIPVGNIIIADDYLLNQKDNQHIAENIFAIVEGLLPTVDFIQDLEVLMVAGDSKERGMVAINKQKIDAILTELDSKAGALKPLSISFGIITHPIDPGKFADFHERFVIMDYAIASSEHGFLDFKNGISTRTNDLNYNWAFHNLGNKVNADIPMKKIKKKLSAVKKLEAANFSLPSCYFKRGYTNIRLLQNLA